MFERKELQEIRTKAYDMADNYTKNTSWKRAFLALGDAANNLDAFIGRSTVLDHDEMRRILAESEKIGDEGNPTK